MGNGRMHLRTETPAKNAPVWSKRNAEFERWKLRGKYESKLIVNPALTRVLVSFQGNKHEPFSRWFKYKEGFSNDFVTYCLKQFAPPNKKARKLLDPFAGAGAALLTSYQEGWSATGIELLPVAVRIIKARVEAVNADAALFREECQRLRMFNSAPKKTAYHFPHLRITQKAFSEETERHLSDYMEFLSFIQDDGIRNLFWFAVLSVLEDISYTRKDGQYLRWDRRSGRDLRSSFEKGAILPFDTAIQQKLSMMEEDLMLWGGMCPTGKVRVIEGSCLEELSLLGGKEYDLVITSPPYCNRYDYTRTYALELAFLNQSEEEVRELRQRLLSATVENRSKREYLRETYQRLGKEDLFLKAEESFVSQRALQEVLNILWDARDKGQLNNTKIPDMVSNYFFEMSLVVHCLGDVVADGGRVVMVNDNIQYHGQEIPADLILSEFAEDAGFETESIWVLPKGKGNSSQQMGVHGRNEMRKCVYVWRKR